MQLLSSVKKLNRVVLLSTKRKTTVNGDKTVNYANFNVAGKDVSRVVSADNTVTFEKKTYSLKSGVTLCRVTH